MNRPIRTLLLAAAIALALPATAPRAEPFTFQGFLEQAGTPLNGSANLAFKLYDAQSAGSQIGSTLTANAWPVAAGVFSIDLDFTGVAFTGAQRWLQVEVNGTPLSGRIAVQPAPLAASANALRGFNVLGSTPSSGQVLAWNGSAWAPTTGGGGSYTAGTGLTLTGSTFSVNFAGSGAANTASRSDHGHFGANWSGSAAHGLTLETNDAFVPLRGFANATGTTQAVGVLGEAADSSEGIGVRGRGNRHGVQGQALTAAASGVHGVNNDGSGAGVGVLGESAGVAGIGVHGRALHATGPVAGVRGETTSSLGNGVQGINTNGSGGSGVYGLGASALGRGVLGVNQATTGDAAGVYGQTASGAGYGVIGYNAGASGSGAGVRGVAESSAGMGVRGDSAGIGGRGVYGRSTATSGLTAGVEGYAASDTGYGVLGSAVATTGEAFGVFGSSASNSGRGVYGVALASGGTTSGVYGSSASDVGRGVYGIATSASGTGAGVYGVSSGSGLFASGVEGRATSSTGVTNGIYGFAASPNGAAVFAEADASSGTNYGVYAVTHSPTGFAGYFSGNVHVNGNFTASGTKSFLIDHPLDPANRVLYHYNIESPEPFNLYRGTVRLDAFGAAEIELPEYFEAINADFSYQLTAVGAAMPNLHVAREVAGNRFLVAGGVSGKSVSWQVTAVRHDPWTRDRGFETEAEKPAHQKGYYLYPTGYGQDQSKAIGQETRKRAAGVRQ